MVCYKGNHWCENGILRHKREENGDWRRLQNEELHSLYRSLNIVRGIRSRRLRWAGHVARMEEDRSVFKILSDTRKIPL
jgi:Trehalose and maltose hydrolases (possible phosphorylases)